MRVKCLSLSPSPQQIESLGESYYTAQSFGVRVGTTYTVLGMTFYLRSELYGTGATVEIDNDDGHLTTVPLCLFEIIDDRASRHWLARHWRDGTLALWPPSFFLEFYRDDLSEDVPAVVSDYERLKRKMETEVLAVNAF